MNVEYPDNSTKIKPLFWNADTKHYIPDSDTSLDEFSYAPAPIVAAFWDCSDASLVRNLIDVGMLNELH